MSKNSNYIDPSSSGINLPAHLLPSGYMSLAPNKDQVGTSGSKDSTANYRSAHPGQFNNYSAPSGYKNVRPDNYRSYDDPRSNQHQHMNQDELDQSRHNYPGQTTRLVSSSSVHSHQSQQHHPYRVPPPSNRPQQGPYVPHQQKQPPQQRANHIPQNAYNQSHHINTNNQEFNSQYSNQQSNQPGYYNQAQQNNQPFYQGEVQQLVNPSLQPNPGNFAPAGAQNIHQQQYQYSNIPLSPIRDSHSLQDYNQPTSSLHVTRKAPVYPDYEQRNSSSSSLPGDRKAHVSPIQTQSPSFPTNTANRNQNTGTNPPYPIDNYNRKAPKKYAQQNETRRIVSSPSMPQYSSMPFNQESRTKSLSSASMKYQQTKGQLNNGNSGSSSNRVAGQGNSGSSIHHTFSLSSKSRSFTSISKLSSLSTKKHGSSSSLTNTSSSGKIDRIASSGTLAKSPLITQPGKPLVYPALLSEVAKLFRESIILTINTKDGLEYHDTFTGKMSVDIICRIIRTNDRNLALLLGRSLDAQKFFHDVTYQHRLRDSVHEVFTFSHNYNDMQFYQEDPSSGRNSASNSKHGSFVDPHIQELTSTNSTLVAPPKISASEATGVNGIFTILTDCYSPTCTKNSLCYSIACPRRLEQQARLNLKPQGGLRRAVSRLSLHEKEETKTLWHETVLQSILDKLDKQEKMRQELIYEFIYTERDYVKDLEFMTDFYILPLRNPANNIIPENQRETFIHTVFGGVGDLLRLAKSMSDALTRRQQQQKPVIETFADVFLDYVGSFDPFIRYSGNKVFASFEHERQQQVNMKYARFLDAIEKKPESRKQDLSSFLMKGVQRPARYQLLLNGILKNTKPDSPDHKSLVKAKEEIEKILVKINIQTGESTDRHKVMVLHRLLGKQTLENRFNFKLNYNNRIIYQVTLSRKRDNEKIDLYLFEHAILLVKHKIQNKREQHKVFEKPIYLSLLFINTGIEIPNVRTIMNHRYRMSLLSDTSIKNRIETSNYIGTSSNSNARYQINFLGLGREQVHTSLYAEDVALQNQLLQQVYNQQKKLIEKHDMFSLTKYETKKFHGSNKINCAIPCYGGKKLLYGTDTGLWISTVRSISMKSNEKIVSDPTLVVSKVYVTQVEELVEYSKLLVLADKNLYEFDLSCIDSLDHVKNTKSGKLLATHISFFKTGICDGKLIVCGGKVGTHSIVIFEPTNPFDRNPKNKNRRIEIREVSFSSDPITVSFLKTKICVGCTKGWEILSLETGKKEPILDEADPSLDFAIQKESVTPLAIHRLDKEFMLCYAEFVFLINRNGWRISHDWFINWEGTPQNLAYFFPYILSFEPGFIEIRNLHTTNIERTLIGENIRFLHSNEHEAMYACEENGYDIIVSIDFLNLKPKE